jgi:hypothetical protein
MRRVHDEGVVRSEGRCPLLAALLGAYSDLTGERTGFGTPRRISHEELCPTY